MTSLDILSLGGATAPTRIDPVQLFMDADIVVQAVIIGLVLASIWTWTIIVGFSLRMGRVRKGSARFEQDFWTSEDPERMLQHGKPDTASGRVAGAGFAEWRRSAKKGIRNHEAALARIGQAMQGQVAYESDRLADRLNFLATTGSVAPFVGLFGTVWGIMNSFFQIGMQQNSSLAVVAPGISEALFATAIGLFAAIPAVIAYNRLSNAVNGFEAHLTRFADRVYATVSRELEQG